MLGSTKTITIINHWFDKTADADQYACHVFAGCSWYGQFIHAADTAGLHRACIHKIRIPATESRAASYLEPQQWMTLPAEKKPQFWTLGCESKVVKGAVKSVTAKEYAALARNYTVAADLTWHDSRDGIQPHWYVEGR